MAEVDGKTLERAREWLKRKDVFDMRWKLCAPESGLGREEQTAQLLTAFAEQERDDERELCCAAVCYICETGESFGIKLQRVPVQDAVRPETWWHEPAKGNPKGVGHQLCNAAAIRARGEKGNAE